MEYGRPQPANMQHAHPVSQAAHPEHRLSQEQALVLQRERETHTQRWMAAMALAASFFALVVINMLVWGIWSARTGIWGWSRLGYVPWPAWVTLVTVFAFIFYALNTLPLLFHRHYSYGTHWNYWVVANLAALVLLAWIIYWLVGGARRHHYLWPLWVTLAAALIALASTVMACMSGYQEKQDLGYV